MNFIVILATMTAFWHRGSTQPSERKGKFFSLSSDEMWSDIFGEVDDPLPKPANTLSVRDHVLKKLKKTTENKPEPLPPLPIPQQLVQRLTTPSPVTQQLVQRPTTPLPVIQQSDHPEPTSFYNRRRNVTKPEPFMVFDTSTQKFEVTPAGFVSSHAPPITDGMFLIGGQFGQPPERPPNMTGEKAKLFWGAVGDIIETVPFLPIQVNVPDLLAAMASFFAERVPFVNRVTNPNKPRPNNKLPVLPEPAESNYADLPVGSSLLEYRQMVTTSTSRPKKNKKRKQNKNKNKKNGHRRTTENYRVWGSSGATTPKPSKQITSKWFGRPTAAPVARATTENLEKLFHHNNSPGAEQVKYKNFELTRKNNRWADKELFNFKYSDISNSPIMILNMPSRPVYLYKFKHEQKTEYPIVDPDNKRF